LIFEKFINSRCLLKSFTRTVLGTVLLLPLSPHDTLGCQEGSKFDLPEVVDKVRAGKFAEAETLVKSLLSDQPLADAYRWLGYILELQEKLQQAEQAYRKSLELRPSLAESSVRLGITYGKGGKFDRCIETLQPLANRIDGDPEALFYLCLAYLETGEEAQGLAVAARAEKLIQTDPEVVLPVLRLLVWKELYSESVPALSRLVRHLPNSPKANYLLALSLFKMRKYAEMWPYLERAKELDADSPPTLLLYAAGLIESNRFSEAKEFAKKAHRLEPGDPQGLYLLARASLGEGAYGEAIESLEPLVRSEPADADPYLLLLEAYRRKDEIKKAFDLSLRLTQLFPDNPEAHLNAGMDMQLSGEIQRAETHFRKAVELSAKDPELSVKARFGLATVLSRQGNYADAAPLLEELVELKKEDDYAKVELGEVYLNTGRYEDASRLLQQAVKLNPKNKRAHLLLGKAFTRLEKHEQAEEHFKAFQDLENAEKMSANEPFSGSRNALH
jgi:tetratricopeptide (TPR) repeat protein